MASATWATLVLAGLAVLLAMVWWLRSGRTMATVTRWGAALRRKAGVASSLDIARVGGTVAMRRRAPQVRPSLRTDTRRARLAQLLTLPPIEVAVRLCRVAGLGHAWAGGDEAVPFHSNTGPDASAMIWAFLRDHRRRRPAAARKAAAR